MTRRFLIVMSAVAVAATVQARSESQPSAGAMLGEGFGEVSGWVLKAAEAVPADKYSYRPIGTVRTFGQQVAHVADAYNWYCANGAGRKTEWSDAIEKGPNDKATLIAKLKTATSGCAAMFKTAPLSQHMGGVVAHTNLHYGNVITYMRMLGLTPPSS